jgi:rSAM/selenodomain-associated transferase 2
MKLSIIIPTFNEGAIIRASLKALAPMRSAGHEIIVVDGGSHDDTVSNAQPLADRMISCERGRARQMNAGAKAARGNVLVFLHADTLLPLNADSLIIDGMRQSSKNWGRFDIRLAGRRPPLRIVETLMNWRSRLSGISTGDQCLFVRREVFEAIGGFPDIALMEDVAISRLLKRHGRPLCIRNKVITSSRRWEQRGILRTVLLMWRLRLGYFFGEDPRHLARLYQRQ